MSLIFKNLGNGASFGPSKATVDCLTTVLSYYSEVGKLEGKGNFRITVNDVSYLQAYDG